MKKRWDEIFSRIARIKNPMVCEVGVDNGKLSRQLLSMHKGLTLYMVDRWAPPPAGDSYATSGASIVEQDKAYFERTYKNCLQIAAQFKGRAIIMRGESLEIAQSIKDHTFDLVFIDADHSYEGCRNDILAWEQKVKKGGWLSGHDYNHPDQGEVKKAVDELLIEKNIVLGENRTWFYKVK